MPLADLPRRQFDFVLAQVLRSTSGIFRSSASIQTRDSLLPPPLDTRGFRVRNICKCGTCGSVPIASTEGLLVLVRFNGCPPHRDLELRAVQILQHYDGYHHVEISDLADAHVFVA